MDSWRSADRGTGSDGDGTAESAGGVVATNAATYDRFTNLGSGDTLGDNEHFRNALPDVDDARLGIWVDLAGLTQAWGFEDENIDPIAGVGLTASYEGDDGEFRFRLVTT